MMACITTEVQKIHHRLQWKRKNFWNRGRFIRLLPIGVPGKQRHESNSSKPTIALTIPSITIIRSAVRVLIKKLSLDFGRSYCTMIVPEISLW
jgi:hypothetical protein